MIRSILDRLKKVDGAIVREGFYAQGAVKEPQFIFLQPHTDLFGAKNGVDRYRNDLALQVVAGINLTRTASPTADLVNLVRNIRESFYKDQRDITKPIWLNGVVNFSESEPCKYIMPEAHEKHGLAVITLSITQTLKFGDQL